MVKTITKLFFVVIVWDMQILIVNLKHQILGDKLRLSLLLSVNFTSHLLYFNQKLWSWKLNPFKSLNPHCNLCIQGWKLQFNVMEKSMVFPSFKVNTWITDTSMYIFFYLDTSGSSESCSDIHKSQNCETWKNKGFCKPNSKHYNFMLSNCSLTCQHCCLTGERQINFFISTLKLT